MLCIIYKFFMEREKRRRAKKTERFAVIDCSIVLTLTKFDWLKDQRTLQPISGNIHNSSTIGGGHPIPSLVYRSHPQHALRIFVL